ncbi:MAG: DUF4342 domain-containing protein [Clostridiales bacterium]|nr:DUF4342 domain-containing protein [Clostridiales bacterium]
MEFQNGNFAYEQEPQQTQQTQQPEAAQEAKKEGIFSKLFRTRIKVAKGDLAIMNVSSLFLIFSLLSALWLVVIGAVIALLLGYRFSIEKNSPDFCGEFKELVKDAGSNVRSAVNSFVE